MAKKVITRIMKIFCIVLSSLIIILIGYFIYTHSIDHSNAKQSMIYGVVYDGDSGIGINNELAVVLIKKNDPYWNSLVYFPNVPDNPGYYEFTDLGPGSYFIEIRRSWEKVYLTESEPNYINGGWFCAYPVEVIVKRSTEVNQDIALDFYASQYWSETVDDIRARGTYAAVFVYADRRIFWDDSNLIGKTMFIEVTWNNSITSRSDFIIDVLGIYSSTEENYEPGPRRESITIDIDDSLLSEESERDQFYWEIIIDTLPSPDIRPVDFEILWTIQ